MSANVIMIEPVGRCVATCDYCPQGRGLLPKLSPSESLITSRVLEKALFLAKKGDQRIIFLHHRGEPLLHPDIHEIVRQVRESGFLACLSTNLIVATESQLARLLKAGINQVEVHYSGGRTKLSHKELLERVHALRKLNWSIRNNGCRVELNYALQGAESEESVRKEMSASNFYDETMSINFYRPHDWPSLIQRIDRGIEPSDCEWYKTRSCAVLCNGDVVICCLDQWASSKKANILDIDDIGMEHLSDRAICRGCIQYDWFTGWLKREILEIPGYLERRRNIDSVAHE